MSKNLRVIKEVLNEISEDVLEKAAAFDRYVDTLEGDLEGIQLVASVEMCNPAEEQIRKAAALERIVRALQGGM